MIIKGLHKFDYSQKNYGCLKVRQCNFFRLLAIAIHKGLVFVLLSQQLHQPFTELSVYIYTYIYVATEVSMGVGGISSII